MLLGTEPHPLPQTGIGLLDTILRMIHHDPFGGLSVSPLSSPALVRQTAQELPALLRALERLRANVLFSEAGPSELGVKGAKAMTRFIPRTYEGGLSNITQMMFPRFPESQSLAHEGLHALYGPETSAPPTKYAKTILDFLVPHPTLRANLLRKYSGNEAHAALAAMAERMAVRQGVGVRQFTFPPPGGS